ncbi:copper resistance protein B [Marinobacter metalliresistant]|uniref:Copper resistance protein B n=1 Tax=Marinobacter metalliresistant TaxID=2961995 RepID=A0ABZ2W410_9GAMM
MMYLGRKIPSVMSFNLFGVFCLVVLALPLAPVLAQEAATENGSMQGGDAPADARDPDAQSGGYEYRGMAGWEETDEIVFNKVIFDQLEFRNNDGADTLRWDMQGWRGTDYKKLWFKFEGDDEVSANAGELELQALYSRSVTSFWDFQIGGRFDRAYNSDVSSNRFLGVIGFQGLAPYWFELEPALFLSEDGDVSARITATYDLLFSQRLILQPRFEANVAGSEVREFGVGSGLNDIQLGFRLRYEFRREVAPYIGVSWQRQFGNTADLTRADGGDVDNLALVAGFRVWF